MVNVIKKTFDIKIQNPIKLPATTPCCVESIQCRFARTISVRIYIEHWFQNRFQIQFNRHLCNSIRHGWNAKAPSSARLGYQDCSDGRWEIASRGHSVSDLVKIVLKIFLKHPKAYCVHTGSAIIAFYPDVSIPYRQFRNIK